MAQFQVPQFIEIEQKIIGGILTMRQFLTLAAGAGVLFGLFLAVNFFTWIILATFISSGIIAVSFVKINGRSLSSLMKAAFFYYWNPSFYLWRTEDEYGVKEPETKTTIHKQEEAKREDINEIAVPETFRTFAGQGSGIHIGKDSSVALTEKKPVKEVRDLSPKEAREHLKIGKQIQSLWEKISTSKDLIPKREQHMNAFQKERIESGYQTMRRATGEIEVAKRVDFK